MCSSPADRALFYELLADAMARFRYRVYDLCLMTNHVHLAPQAGEATLSPGMQNLAFRYTRYRNPRRKCVGHLFQSGVLAYTRERFGTGSGPTRMGDGCASYGSVGCDHGQLRLITPQRRKDENLITDARENQAT